MFDGLFLQAVLIMLGFVAAVVIFVWFIWGLRGKSAAFIIAVGVPFAIGAAIVVAVFL